MATRRSVLSVAAAAVCTAALVVHDGSAQAANSSAASSATVARASCALQRLPNGLQYCDLRLGTGQVPSKGGFIKIHYTASIEANGDPVEFDSSYTRNKPLMLKLGERELIEGIDVGILGSEAAGLGGMRPGGIRRLVLPPGDLQRMGTKSLTWVVGMSEAIESTDAPSDDNGNPTADLVFDVELLPLRRTR